LSHSELVSPNLLKESGNAPQSWGEVIVGDITYVPLKGGKFCYLAMFQDKLTRRIVGSEVSERMTAELVVKALKKATNNGLIKRNAIVHTDRGSQYVSTDYRQMLHQHGLRQSMSGKGNCYDNAQAESFFSRFKTELIESGVFEDYETARWETTSYIEGYYNKFRRHSGIKYQIPIEFEKDLRKNEQRRLRESFLSTIT
jgi:putative transposase